MALIREEVDLMNQLDHPNILRLFGVVQEDAQLNVFVEWMAGGSIARLAKLMYFHLKNFPSCSFPQERKERK